MSLIPREIEKLDISHAGFLAQRRLARGVKLNHTETAVLITSVLHELIRDGNRSVPQLGALGKHILGRKHVLPSVTATLTLLQIEGTFPTGTHLVAVEQPISTDDGDMDMALYGSFLPCPKADVFSALPASEYESTKMPGAIVPANAGDIVLNSSRKRLSVTVTNKGSRPIHIGSHFHFMEANPYLEFDRTKAYGYHLDIPAGDIARFEPDKTDTVALVQMGGLKTIRGGPAAGTVESMRVDSVLENLIKAGYMHAREQAISGGGAQACTLDRMSYALRYGPTVGDAIRLGSTELWVKIEKDYTSYGDECNLGDGKTLRDGAGQASGRSDNDCADVVITNAVIIDWSGIYKADIGIKDGVISGIGKAGNPDSMDGVSLVIGSNTDVISAEGMIVTAGGIDTHVHLICPQQANEALASGITTMFGGGTGPSSTSQAVNCTSSKILQKQMMQACDYLPVNYGIVGKGSDSGKPGLHEQCNSGVAGLKLHEDLGCTPSTIDNCLSVCDEYDIQCQIHSDSMNESCFVEQTAAAFKDRSIHVYHIEGAGGGHVPDVIRLLQEPNVLASSTTPSMPYTTDTVEEHFDMASTCHHLSKVKPEDVALAKIRVRDQTIAAEDILHDTGAISIMNSDSQAMGRCGEVITRTWNTAHKNKVQHGRLPGDDEEVGADNHRVKRYISKYTINPAITQGISHAIGSVEVGKLADLVIWERPNFGTKPYQVLKKGFTALAQIGDPNASIPGVQPVISRQLYAPMTPQSSVMFVSKAGMENGAIASYNLKKDVAVVQNCRSVSRQDMKFNSHTPKVEVDPVTYTVKADGEELKTEPASMLPLTQQHFLF